MGIRHVEQHFHSQVLWAKKSFPGKFGRYVAVRLRHGRLSVGVRHPGFVDWIPAERALTLQEAERWARSGF